MAAALGATGMAPEGFLEYVLDQLHGLGLVLPRAMFGGYGLYHDGVFFAIVDKDRLYFKTDERSRARYEALGSAPFRANDGQILWTYYEVPVSLLADPPELVRFAQEAVNVQRSSAIQPRHPTTMRRRDSSPT